jgi:hypothetical protein
VEVVGGGAAGAGPAQAGQIWTDAATGLQVETRSTQKGRAASSQVAMPRPGAGCCRCPLPLPNRGAALRCQPAAAVTSAQALGRGRRAAPQAAHAQRPAQQRPDRPALLRGPAGGAGAAAARLCLGAALRGRRLRAMLHVGHHRQPQGARARVCVSGQGAQGAGRGEEGRGGGRREGGQVAPGPQHRSSSSSTAWTPLQLREQASGRREGVAQLGSRGARGAPGGALHEQRSCQAGAQRGRLTRRPRYRAPPPLAPASWPGPERRRPAPPPPPPCPAGRHVHAPIQLPARGKPPGCRVHGG